MAVIRGQTSSEYDASAKKMAQLPFDKGYHVFPTTNFTFRWPVLEVVIGAGLGTGGTSCKRHEMSSIKNGARGGVG